MHCQCHFGKVKSS